jgi:hypothetical protein
LEAASDADKKSIDDGRNLSGYIGFKKKVVNVIIFVAIEQVFSSFNNNRAIPMRQKDVDADTIHQVIHAKQL